MKSELPNKLTAIISLHIPFHDVDPSNVVWHGRYFKYFELARCALLDQINYNYEAMAKSGYVWPIVKTNAKFVRPLVFNQIIHVAATLREWEMRLLMDYRIEDENGVLHTKASTIQVPLDARTNELQLGTPQVLLNRIQEYLNA